MRERHRGPFCRGIRIRLALSRQPLTLALPGANGADSLRSLSTSAPLAAVLGIKVNNATSKGEEADLIELVRKIRRQARFSFVGNRNKFRKSFGGLPAVCKFFQSNGQASASISFGFSTEETKDGVFQRPHSFSFLETSQQRPKAESSFAVVAGKRSPAGGKVHRPRNISGKSRAPCRMRTINGGHRPAL